MTTTSYVNNCVIRIRVTFSVRHTSQTQTGGRWRCFPWIQCSCAQERERASFGKELMQGKLQSKKLSLRAFHAKSLKMTRGEMEGVSIELRQTGGYSSYRTSEQTALSLSLSLSLQTRLSIMDTEMLALTGCNLDRQKANRSRFVDRRGQTGKHQVGKALNKFSDCQKSS